MYQHKDQMILGKGERKQKKPKKENGDSKEGGQSSPNKVQHAICECLQFGYNNLTAQPVSLLETILLYAQNPAFLFHEEPSSLQLLSQMWRLELF